MFIGSGEPDELGTQVEQLLVGGAVGHRSISKCLSSSSEPRRRSARKILEATVPAGGATEVKLD